MVNFLGNVALALAPMWVIIRPKGHLCYSYLFDETALYCVE